MHKTFYVTTPIYYVNDVPHLGHAYTSIAADVLARYYRMKLGPDNVYFLTGTDEHGAKIEEAASAQHTTPLLFVDEKSAAFKSTWDSLSISYNDFIRTTEPRHEKEVVALLNTLKVVKTPKGNDFVYQGEYEGLYCVGCESYKTESELVDGKCKDHNKVPTLLKEKNWFFRMSDYTDILKEKIESDEFLIRPEKRKNEVLGLLELGFTDIAVSRQTVEWGIQLPFDSSQTVYVWIEALMNYVTALKGTDKSLYKKFWPANVHLMAKDILKFHAIMWPIMLLALEVPLPKQVFAHGFFTINGTKMSKTIGNVIDPMELVTEYGADATRYLLLSQFGFGTDGDFNKERLKDAYNNALANELGNLVSRVLAMTEKYFGGTVPEYTTTSKKRIAFDSKTDWGRYHAYIENLEFENALGVIWETIRDCNVFVDIEKPWQLAKDDTEALADVLYTLLESIRHIALMLSPFMPDVSEKILFQLGFDSNYTSDNTIEALNTWGGLPINQTITKGEVLFPKNEQSQNQ